MKHFSQVFLVISAIGLVLGACSGASNPPAAPAQPIPTPDQTSGVTFKTPEAAITYYLAGVAQNDIHKILQACAIDEAGGKFKFDLYAARLGNVLNLVSGLSPADYAFYAEINQAHLSSQILDQVKNFSYGLLSNEKVDGRLIVNADAARVGSFIKAVDPGRLSNLQIKEISLTNKQLMSDAKYLANAAGSAKVYGADESTERVVLFSFEQNYYYIGFTLLRYGDNWKISSQSSPLSNASFLGTPEKTTVDGFESMVNGN